MDKTYSEIRERANQGCNYFYIADDGKIKQAKDKRQQADEFRYYTGNYYLENGEAETKRHYMCVKQIIKDIAIQSNNKEENKKMPLNIIKYGVKGLELQEIKENDKYLYIPCRDKNFIEVAEGKVGLPRLISLIFLESEEQ